MFTEAKEHRGDNDGFWVHNDLGKHLKKYASIYIQQKIDGFKHYDGSPINITATVDSSCRSYKLQDGDTGTDVCSNTLWSYLNIKPDRARQLDITVQYVTEIYRRTLHRGESLDVRVYDHVSYSKDSRVYCAFITTSSGTEIYPYALDAVVSKESMIRPLYYPNDIKGFKRAPRTLDEFEKWILKQWDEKTMKDHSVLTYQKKPRKGKIKHHDTCLRFFDRIEPFHKDCIHLLKEWLDDTIPTLTECRKLFRNQCKQKQKDMVALNRYDKKPPLKDYAADQFFQNMMLSGGPTDVEDLPEGYETEADTNRDLLANAGSITLFKQWRSEGMPYIIHKGNHYYNNQTAWEWLEKNVLT